MRVEQTVRKYCAARTLHLEREQYVLRKKHVYVIGYGYGNPHHFFQISDSYYEALHVGPLGWLDVERGIDYRSHGFYDATFFVWGC